MISFKEIEDNFNSPSNKENVGLLLQLSKEKSTPNKTVFEVLHEEDNESICRMTLNSSESSPGRFDVSADFGPKDEVRMKFVWENGKIRFYENQGNPEFIDATYQKLKEWILHTETFSPVFMKLNDLTWEQVHENVNPMIRFICLPDEYKKYALHEYLRFETICEMFEYYAPRKVLGSYRNLSACVSRLSYADFIKYSEFFEFCKENNFNFMNLTVEEIAQLVGSSNKAVWQELVRLKKKASEEASI